MAGTSSDGGCAAAPLQEDSLYSRRIEFHTARKPSSAMSRGGSGVFCLEKLIPSSDPRSTPDASAESALKAPSDRISEGRDFYEHGLDPELSFRITFRRIGAGLANLGNTCFLNSVLQCLTYTEPFAAYLQSGKHKSSCHTSGFCAMCALQNHVMVALQSTGKILSPFHLVKNLRCISRNFAKFEQEDAHEYMVQLLESMHKCCLPSGVPIESPSAYEKSLVHKIFGGHLRSQVKCMQCSYGSNKFDPFLDLSLEIVKADSLQKALKHFTEEEELDGGARQYECQHCKKKVRARKQLTIHKAPYVLTIHLKRFSPYIPGQKIDRKVEFGPKLDLKPFVSDSHIAALKYTLYGVIVHAGWNTHSGHYHCFVRTSSGMWHSLDDNKVSQVSEKTVLEQKAYMLFYVRDRTPTVKSSVNAVRKDNVAANASGNKMVSQPLLGLNSAIQNGSLERKLNGSIFTSDKIKTNVTVSGNSTLVCNTSLNQPLKELNSCSWNDCKIKLVEGPYTQDDSDEVSNIQPNCNAFPTKAQQETSKDSREICDPSPTSTTHQKSTEELSQKTQPKYNCIAITPPGKDASFTRERIKSGVGGCHLSNDSDAVVKSYKFTSQQQNPAFSGLTSEIYAKRVVAEITTHEGETAASGIVPNNEVCSKEEVGNEAAAAAAALSQSDPKNGFIGNDAHSPTDIKIICHKRCLDNLHCQEEVPAESGITNTSYKMDLKPKKLAKCFLKSIYYGRKQLFLTSLRLHRNKKLKRTRKRCLIYKDIEKGVHLDDHRVIDQQTSTSEAVGLLSMEPKCRQRKRSRSSSNDNNIQHKVDNEKHNSGDYVTTVDERNRKFCAELATSEQLQRCLYSAANQCNSRETDANGKGRRHEEFMSFLTRGLREVTVAQWDNIGLPEMELPGIGSLRNNKIGYLLDEWDEEYDRGRRKKIKKSRQHFSGPNPFEDAASMRLQQKRKLKVDQTRLGNQPLRI
ncbi:ubiquitin carboxyl-terminal hydrolase 23-like isoform X1 [Typha angustifolia]|uniref:ubiquitin carboxyl-terminal hydrolase 23-like isoform X1 n=2 Tax=Typha angustifolia TaxID=59011 RepID=UPI003C2F43B3